MACFQATLFLSCPGQCSKTSTYHAGYGVVLCVIGQSCLARVLLGSCSGPVHHQLRLQLLGISKELETVAVAVRKRMVLQARYTLQGHLSSHLLLLFSILP